jgi:hypothetical protein
MWPQIAFRSLITIALGALVACFGCANSQQQPQPAEATAQTASDQKPVPESETLTKAKEADKATKGGGKVSPICSMFTQQEVELMYGARVKPGETAGPLGSACQWNAAEGEGYFQIQIIDDVKYWGKQSLVPGYEELKGIGKEAFVVPEFGEGYTAQALTDKQIIAIGMRGGATSRDAAVGALKTVLERLQRSGK